MCSTFCDCFILKTTFLAQQLLALLVGTACCTLFTVHFRSKQLQHESVRLLLHFHVTKRRVLPILHLVDFVDMTLVDRLRLGINWHTRWIFVIKWNVELK